MVSVMAEASHYQLFQCLPLWLTCSVLPLVGDIVELDAMCELTELQGQKWRIGWYGNRSEFLLVINKPQESLKSLIRALRE